MYASVCASICVHPIGCSVVGSCGWCPCMIKPCSQHVWLRLEWETAMRSVQQSNHVQLLYTNNRCTICTILCVHLKIARLLSVAPVLSVAIHLRLLTTVPCSWRKQGLRPPLSLIDLTLGQTVNLTALSLLRAHLW